MRTKGLLSSLSKTSFLCGAAMLLLMSFGFSRGTEAMDDLNPADVQALEIGDTERDRIFVTMNATFKDEEQCRIAMETIVGDAHAAYGVTSHFWFRSEDGKSLFVVEQYADRKALRKAVKRFTSARMDFFASIEVSDVSVYGDAPLGVKVMFSPLRPTYMSYYDGYSKAVAESAESGIQDHERDRVFVATNLTLTDEEKMTQAVEGLLGGAYAESGTHSFFLTQSKGGDALFLLEQYADEAALLEHLEADQGSRSAFLESATVGDVTVYGAQSEQVKEILAPLNPTYMGYYGGYSK